MTPEPNAADVSRGAAQLLRIARENDKYGALAHHFALYVVVELAMQLARVSRQGQDAITALLEAPQRPAHFLEFVAMTLVFVRRRQDAAYDAPAGVARGAASMPVWSEFDLHASQALAQVLADVTWPERAAETFDGPPFMVCVERLAALADGTLLESILRNYVGNLLQTYFAEARVRSSVPGLPKETEVWLRSKDGATIARRAMAALGDRVGEPERVLDVLRQVLIEVAERRA